jgi:hypothetical protein
MSKLTAAINAMIPLIDQVMRETYGDSPAPGKTAGGDVIDAMKATLAKIPKPAPGSAALNPYQFRLTYMLAILVHYAYDVLGLRLTYGTARQDKGCTVCGGGKRKPTSLHYDGLAVDFNLFRHDGTKWDYKDDTESHRKLGEFWESIGGSWGGRFNDGNHYSLAYGGRK